MILSYIVPAYNVAGYLERCIKSIYSQELPSLSFEVIIVNDGSTDNTAEVANQLLTSGAYANLQVVTQSNMGLSEARNTGIRNARGDYFWCIDSDDWLQSGLVPSILSDIERYKPDLFFVELQMINPDNNQSRRECHQDIEKYKLFDGKDAILLGYKPCSACSVIMRRSFINRNGLKFYRGLYHEDVEFMYRAVALSDKVLFSDLAPYMYEVHSNTISTAPQESKVIKRLADNAIIADSFIKFSGTLASEDLQKRFIQQARSISMGTFFQLYRESEHKSSAIRNAVVAKFRELGLYPLIPPTPSIRHRMLVVFLNLKFRNYGY